MKQLVVKNKSPEPILFDTALPQVGHGQVLIKNQFSVVSSGTEIAAIENANKGVTKKLQNSSNIEKGIELLKNESDLKQEIFLALTAEEETGLLGAKNYIDKKLIKNASNILIAEPTNLEPKTREKGIVWFDIHSNGRQAHASRPDLGVNAIEELVRLIPKLHNVIPNWEDDLLGKTTLNTGTIMGGTAANVIPQYARARFDSRITPGITNDEVISRYKKVVEEFDSEIKFDFDLIESASSILSKTTNFAELLMENTKKYVSREIEIGGAYYATDGAVFMEYLKNQPEFVIFGPGSTELLHQTDERMEVSQLELSKKIIYESLIMTACN